MLYIICFVYFVLVNIVPCILNMLEGPGEEKHCAYRATFVKVACTSGRKCLYFLVNYF